MHSHYLPFKHLPRETKTLVTEAGNGWRRSDYVTTKDFNAKQIRPHDKYRKEEAHAATSILKRGGSVRMGETLTRAERRELRRLNRAINFAMIMETNPSLEQIKKFYHAEAASDAFRHTAIRRTIRSAYTHGKTPLLARYGTAHSVIARELLEKDRIRITRSIEKQVFNWTDIVHRKLLLGKKPTDTEYLRAYATQIKIDEPFQQRILDTWKRSKKNIFPAVLPKFMSLISHALIAGLTSAQLKKLIASPHINEAFVQNGLPPHPSMQTIIRFIQKKSIYFRNLSTQRQKQWLRWIGQKE